jgi:hypothetical protein
MLDGSPVAPQPRVTSRSSTDGSASRWQLTCSELRAFAAPIAAGGTHLWVPREQADWLGDHPLVVDYFATQHELAEARAETGIIFVLRPRFPSASPPRSPAGRSAPTTGWYFWLERP